MTTMSIKTFLNVAQKLPRDSVLLRGQHGIGKSQVIRQLRVLVAERDNIDLKDFEMIDRRLSQMSEGDMIGLPSTDGNITRFNPPDWYRRACDKPCVLFLDELNRATPEVMQAAFQIVLDRELNGWTLHPQTCVYAAVNASAAYTVNEMDPALLDRFWTIDLVPTVEDFLIWARGEGKLASGVVDFIAGNEKWLDVPKDIEPGKVSPSRRSWARLSAALVAADIAEKPADSIFFPLCLGYVGTEATIAFHGFMKTIEFQTSGEEVLADYDAVKKKVLGLGQEKQNILIEKVATYITKTLKILTDEQGKNLRKFMLDLPGELRVAAWSQITAASGVENITLSKQVHKHCVDTILDVFGCNATAASLAEKPKDSKKTSSKK